MSSEERQRIVREQGSRPAEAEKQTEAKLSREELGRQEGKREAETSHPDTPPPTPSAEDSPDRPVPRS